MIPLVDLTSPAARADLASGLATLGFVELKNHGLEADTMAELRTAADDFFALPAAEKHRSVNAGWPEAAMAGALGLALAGPRHYRDFIVDDAWMNEGGRANATAEDIRRALGLYRKAGAGLATLLLLIMALA